MKPKINPLAKMLSTSSTFSIFTSQVLPSSNVFMRGPPRRLPILIFLMRGRACVSLSYYHICGSRIGISPSYFHFIYLLEGHEAGPLLPFFISFILSGGGAWSGSSPSFLSFHLRIPFFSFISFTSPFLFFHFTFFSLFFSFFYLIFSFMRRPQHCLYLDKWWEEQYMKRDIKRDNLP